MDIRTSAQLEQPNDSWRGDVVKPGGKSAHGRCPAGGTEERDISSRSVAGYAAGSLLPNPRVVAILVSRWDTGSMVFRSPAIDTGVRPFVCAGDVFAGANERGDLIPRLPGPNDPDRYTQCPGGVMYCRARSRSVQSPQTRDAMRRTKRRVSMKIDRKVFLKTTLIAVGATVGLAEIGACGGDDTGGTGGGAGTTGTGGATGSGGSTGTGGTAGSEAGSVVNACAIHEPVETIGANHGHVLTVTMADAAAGVDKTYDIMGTATHTHSVTITAAEFVMLAAGTTIMETSTTNVSHSHPIMVVCA